MNALFNENPEEYRAKNRKMKKERDEATEMIQSMRNALISQVHRDYKDFIGCVRDNREMFKFHLSVADKEVLRNVCNEAKMNSRESKMEDNQLYDEVFGYLIPTEYTAPGQPVKPRIERELRYFSNCTYERFYNWLANPDTQKSINYHPAVKELLKKAIDEQKFKNVRVSDKHKGYEPEDEELFRKVLA